MKLNIKSIIISVILITLVAITGATYLNKNSYNITTDIYKVNNLRWQILDVNKSSPTNLKNTVKVYAPILNYHYIRDYTNPDDQLGQSLSVSVSDFDRQMNYLATNQYNAVSQDSLTLSIQGKFTLPKKPVILTFDDGYQDFYTNAYPILKKYSIKATVYMVYDFIDDKDGRYLTTDELKELSKDDLITIGSHSLSHINLTNTSVDEARRQIAQSKKLLEAKISQKVNHFCYPSGKFNDEILELVKEAGYNSAVSTQNGTKHTLDTLYNLDRVRVSGGATIEQFAGKLQPEFTKK